MRRHGERDIPLPFKIVNYTGYKDTRTYKYVLMTYSQLQEDRLDLAERVLAFYKDPKNIYKRKVHLCSSYFKGVNDYFTLDSSILRSHIARNHPKEKSVKMIKIISYPGCIEARTPVTTELMSFSELREKSGPLAEKVLNKYYDQTKRMGHGRRKINICFWCLANICDYISSTAYSVATHIERKHHQTTLIYKIANYPLEN